MIYNFSCTGNTEWAAKKISAAIGEELRPIPIEPLDQSITLQPHETIGLCFPVHGWRPPLPVREFARRCLSHHPENHYCWILCTAGDDIGETIDIIQKDLASCHLHADSVFSLLMPNTYVGLPFMDVDKEEVVKKKIANAKEKLDICIRHIQNRDTGISLLDTSRWPRINSRILGHLFVKKLTRDTPFTVDHNACIHCGLCAGKCPVENIKMSDDHHPTWLHNGRCLTCFACYHHCPANAIQWGKATRKKGKYYMRANTTT